MYRIPPDLDLSFFVGSTLEQVAIGKYDVQFRFDSGASIALQGEATVFLDGTPAAHWSEETGWSTLAFQNLLNHCMLDVRVLTERVIELCFSENVRLQLCDNSDQYESMQIQSPAGGAPIIVI